MDIDREFQYLNCQVLILGSGIAGLLLALELAKQGRQVIIACKDKLIDSNTACAQGGLAAVTGANPLDSPELHLKDTLAAGAGLTDERIAKLIVEEGPALTHRLKGLGVGFDGDGKDVALEGGHSLARVLHSKDASGKAIATSLIEKLLATNNVRILTRMFALDLIADDDICLGAKFLYEDRTVIIAAGQTVLATGGLGQVFARTTNPKGATGDGIAMAYRAGARLIDMEFVQFHPTALALKDAPPVLISEAVRGAGAILLDAAGKRFAFDYHQDGELATRDVVARAIYDVMNKQGSDSVLLDMRPIGTSAGDRFPNIIKSCRALGIDPLCQPLPVSPAAHYFMGGVATDEFGRTSLKRLWAIGECASTGLHGANRLASNSLLEGGVMALRAAERMMNSAIPQVRTADLPARRQLQSPYAIPQAAAQIKQSMLEYSGLVRSEGRLYRMMAALADGCAKQVPGDRETVENANLALLSWLITRAALVRKESRGAHFRTDYPARNDRQFRQRYFLSRSECGWVEVPLLQHAGQPSGQQERHLLAAGTAG